jgi:hypothetical protein
MDSQIRLGKTVETQAQMYYAALAGLEEARGRINASAPDTIGGSLPGAATQVLYLVNSTAQDPVEPTNVSNPYYDYEYAQEFVGGLTGATVLPPVASDQPGAGTASTIPYKWVRVTLKTEYSAHQDVNQDGVLDSSVPVYWDGLQQGLSTQLTGGVPVYKLTALAVDRSRIRKLVQAEVADPVGTLNALASLGAAGSATLAGISVAGVPNLTVNGTDACGAQSLPGIIAGGTITSSTATILPVTPSSSQNVLPFPQSASTLISSLRASATPILTADPAHVTLSLTGTRYVGMNVALGSQAVGSTPAQPVVVYSDKPLRLSGGTNTGDGILLVNGNLSVTGGFNYRGMIVVAGVVKLASNASGSISIAGAVISSGNLSVNSTASAATSLTTNYDSCAVADSYQILPKTILAFRDLR